MTDDLDKELQEATQAVDLASGLVRLQEAHVARMRQAGIDTQQAEALLAAYRDGARYATKRRNEALGRLKGPPHLKNQWETVQRSTTSLSYRFSNSGSLAMDCAIWRASAGVR